MRDVHGVRYRTIYRRGKPSITISGTGSSWGYGNVVMEAAQATDNWSLIWVDQGFSGEKFARVIQELIGAKVDVVCRTEPGFQVLPKRWIVERTFAWWNQYRRLSKDYELLPEMSESMIYTVMIRLMLKRLVKSQTLPC
jgi:putative transposase